jgi:pantothenate kinase
MKLSINGLSTDAYYNDEEIEKLHNPLLRRLTELQQKLQRRTVVFLSAPPGTGKSTFTAFLEWLAVNDESLPDIQSLPMDGFHYYNHQLDKAGTLKDKGAPHTFNSAKLLSNLSELQEDNATWPQYDRNLHDPVENAIQVTAPLVIIEGNWLLLNQPEWQALEKFCDFAIFISAKPELLEKRLVDRKIQGGLTATQALDFYQRTDKNNVLTVLEGSRPADIHLEMGPSGGYMAIQ